MYWCLRRAGDGEVFLQRVRDQELLGAGDDGFLAEIPKPLQATHNWKVALEAAVTALGTHVLTEDVLFREVTSDNLLRSRRLFTKTNRLPRWAERIFPGKRCVFIIEDSVIDPAKRSLTTLTWNINHATLMRVVERCVFSEHERPVWTQLTREAWITSRVYGLSKPIQEFGLARFKSNQLKAMKGLEHALSNLQKAASLCLGDSAEKQKNLNSAATPQKPQQLI
ncbi:hypothetical protein DNTS_031180 [Danionella cerebrum]|uniref:PRELI/MSF1 domain-containing protein n=1 Tax=Danionella cerebrum TaxID=2873325 RepID=A0A553RPA9_9TELE|nr:hypothetical protein DNTS_031180 [Danionella translucida]